LIIDESPEGLHADAAFADMLVPIDARVEILF
jgi:hypothetical protein